MSMQETCKAHVPADRVLPCPFAWDVPSASDFRDLFAQAHEQSEAVYNGDGSWGHGFVFDESTARWRALFAKPEDYVDWPTVRDTARRLAGYAWALDVEPNPVYYDRLVAGVEWLLKQQLPDGSFPWWVSRTGMPNTDHLYYKNGYAGIGLLEAYRHTRDPRILESVRRAADWTAAWQVSPNNNYNSLACWILAAYYGYEPQPKYLEAAVQKTVEGVLPGQLPNGGWAGHNSWVWYQGIIVGGLAWVLSLLPEAHPQRTTIEACLCRAVNNLIVRLDPQGRLLATFDSEERADAERRRIGNEQRPEYVADAHSVLGLLWVHDLANYPVRPIIAGVLHGYFDHLCQEPPESSRGSHGQDFMVLGYAWRWLSRQNRE